MKTIDKMTTAGLLVMSFGILQTSFSCQEGQSAQEPVSNVEPATPGAENPVPPENTEARPAQDSQPETAETATRRLPDPCRMRLEGPVAVQLNQPALAPSLSPDGLHLAWMGPKYRAYSVVGLRPGANAAAVPVPDLASMVSAPVPPDIRANALAWIPNSGKHSLAVRLPKAWSLQPLATDSQSPNTPASDAPAVPAAVQPRDSKGRTYAAVNDRIVALDAAGETPVSGPYDRYFNPMVSPDGLLVTWQGLTSGIYVYDVATGRTVAVGPGNHIEWVPDSRGFVFDRSQDDGLTITQADIYCYTVETGAVHKITDTLDQKEMEPTVSLVPPLMSFTADDKLYISTYVFTN